MEKTKYFLTLNDAVEFCIANEVSDFYFKKQKVGLMLHYFEKGTKCFWCDICHSITPYDCEGADPHTCADCNPVRVEIEDERVDM